MSARSNPGTSRSGKTAKKTASKRASGRRTAKRPSNTQSPRNATRAKTRSSGPIVFFIALFIVALGTIQLLSTFYTYAISVSELNGLKREEASLIAQKQELENNIARWNDKAYVAAQAREKLGFVFPGEQVVHVLHPEAVTGTTTDGDKNDKTSTDPSSKKALPWYSELAYSFEQADKQPETDTAKNTDQSKNASGDTSTGADSGADTGSDGTKGQQQ
ncbi:FtsB family cell division protein [Bifidobacterium aerophilum]|uniref:Septum formation initiator family protein n=1 Tax=Bifidobacterium aerophilum TaxID=1798155 RepID=A0A6N9Z5J0_9BIFI|nr:septum formation initiator family protein [Bifidobacterium aerophilum]NEG89393.1 septum formation initiator family protein [Bifidobacterium aerophilum]